jgi:cyclopropane fatty-acyl-phospholipid synthase-like methyltransferase
VFVAQSVPVEYFVDLYRRQADPWHFESSEYEQRKYAATIAALPRERYACALEIACSVGVFTNLLAQRCDSLLAVDVSEEALQRARRNCFGRTNVHFERRVMPSDYPHGSFDLTTVCEMGFYLSMPDLALLRSNVIGHSVKGANVVLVHWTPPVQGHASTAEEVHQVFYEAPELAWICGFSAPTYRLDVLERQ